MNQMNSSAQLKASARTSLTGHYGFLISVLLSSFIIIYLFALPFSLTSGVISMIASVFISFLWELIFFHIMRINLLICCQKPASFRDLFLGNTDREKEIQTVYAACIMTAMQFLCMLPSNLLSSFYFTNNNAVVFLFTCIAYTAGIILYGVIYFSIFPVYFLLADCPAPTIKETLKLAVFLSRGNRFKLFYLMASFLPLMLLGMLSCGIGLFWVFSYMNATLTHFYLNLASSKSA